ncbi:odorant receptor 131-2-like [Genypterus blacodes]|uniref:odorant receptor 131-2-like n=1 Tax=Genypterus blacodes TaxID=154954 RepID=UPI003F7644BE
MNSSSYGNNASFSLIYPDSFNTAVAKSVIVVALGIIINYVNGTLIHTFMKNQILYVNPRYILFIHLVVNDMIQVTLATLLFVLGNNFYKINVCFCCIIILFAVLTTLNSPLNLAVMAIECYIAICLPLRYHEVLAIKKTYVLIGLIWAMSTVSIAPDVFVMLVTEPAEFFYSDVVCLRDQIFRTPVMKNKRNISHIIYLVVVWLILIVVYCRIFFTAKAADGQAKKARKTVLLHGFQLLLCMLTFVYSTFKKAAFYWSPKHYLHVLYVCFIIIQILPRFISSIVYGLRDQVFRKYYVKQNTCSVQCMHTTVDQVQDKDDLQSAVK